MNMMPEAGQGTSQAASRQAQQDTSSERFDASKLPASRVGGTHGSDISSGYGVLGKDDTFAKEEKSKGFGVSVADKLKGKISRST